MNIQQIIEQYYELPKGAIQVKTRKREIVVARQMCQKIAYEASKNKTLDYIGQKYGGKNPETVIHSIKTINNLIETDKNIRFDYQQIMLSVLCEITECEKKDAIIQGLMKCVLKHKK